MKKFEEFSIEELEEREEFTAVPDDGCCSNKCVYDPKYKISTKIDISFSESTFIFATFHLGSYRIINNWLLSNGNNVVLIVDEEVYHTQKKHMFDAYSKLKRDFKNKKVMDFRILNVKDRASIFQIKQYIKDGYSLVIYLDGNSGLNKKIDFKKGFIPIDLFDQRINVKNGLDFISKFTKVSVIPVLSYRKNEITYLEFYDIIPCTEVDITKKCYYYLEKLLITYPTQWECWFYIHKWFDRSILTNKQVLSRVKHNDLRFNSDTFIPFTRNNHYFLFNRNNFTAFSIPQNHYKCFVENKIVSENRKQYITLNVLI